MKKIISIIILILFTGVIPKNAHAQFYECGFEEVVVEESVGEDPFMGLYKPIRTDIDANGETPPEAYFPVLVVFVQFKDEGGDAFWPQNQPPIYLD